MIIIIIIIIWHLWRITFLGNEARNKIDFNTSKIQRPIGEVLGFFFIRKGPST